MPRIEQKQAPLKRTSFTLQELQTCKDELRGNLSEETKIQWLITKKAIRIKPGSGGIPEVFVLQYPDGTFPYAQLSELWDQTKGWMERGQKFEAKQVEHYEEIAKNIFEPVQLNF